jgi:hypothetical protein
MTPTVPPSPSAAWPASSPRRGSRTGYTANHACDILNWGRGKVGRFEANQWKRPEMSDIRDLIRIYGIDGAEKEEIEDLAIRARARPWWREYPEIFDGEFPGYENDATNIRVFMPLVLPGLLQTRLHRGADASRAAAAAWRRKALESRLRRQEILDRNRWLRAHVQRRDHRGVAALPVGPAGRPPGADRAPGHDEHPPQRAAAYPAVRGRPADRHAFDDQHLGFRDDEPSLVFVETDYAVEEVSKPESVQGYTSNRSSVLAMPRLNPRTPGATSSVSLSEWSS